MKKNIHVHWNDFEKEMLEQPGFSEVAKEVEIEYQVARAILKARLQKGMTQADLARAMHTTQSVISRAESARVTPSLSFLKRLANVLGSTLHIQLKPL